MKELLAVMLLVSSAMGEPPAPYPPSGWRPAGPSFELPQRGQQPQGQQPSQYLPPVDPRNSNTPQYPEEDVSVQGLPQPEPRPLFQASPISGKQYTGPSFNKDLKSLDQSFQKSQYERQQERYREYQRQQQLESQTPKQLPNPVIPGNFARTTTEASTTTRVTPNTGFDLNREETFDESEPKEKTSVEVTKQNVQEFPGEFFISSLAQLQLQPQFVPLQSSGLSGAYVQSQKQVTGFDGPAHLSALPSILAQQKDQGYLVPNDQVLVQQPISQFAQAQVTQFQPQPQVQTQFQPDPVVLQAPSQFQPNIYLQPNPDAVAVQPTQYQPAVQPQTQFQVQAFQPAQPEEDKSQNQDSQLYYQQPIVVQPQSSQNQEQFYQPQTQYLQPAQPQQFVQPQQFAQPQFTQPQTQIRLPQPADPQNQYAQPQQGQYAEPQTQFIQPQPADPQNQFALQQQGQYAQPQTQFIQPQPADPQNQYVQPQQGQFAQPQTQFIQPQPADPQNQYEQPQGQFGQPQNQFASQPGFVQQLQPAEQYGQPQLIQPTDPQNFQPQYQPTQYQAQLVQFLPQNQFQQPQSQFADQRQFSDQRQTADQTQLQSGLEGQDQERNDIDEPEDTKEGATAVATAFGTRTQPRVNTRYGAPFPVPKVQANPGYSTTTESAVEDITEEGPAVAQAVAVANGEKRRNSRLRSRRLRPVYAVDRSGRLVLAEA